MTRRTSWSLKPALCLLMVALALPGLADAAPKAAKPDKAGIASSAFRYFVDKPPAWVQPLAAPAEPGVVDASTAYRILLRDDQNQQTDKGQTRYTHCVLQPLQKSALDKVAQVEIEFSPEYQTLTLHEFSVIRDGVRLNKLDRSRVRLIQREKDLEKRMYNGVVSASVVLDDIRVGDQVEYAYTIQGSNPIFGNRIDFAYPLSGGDAPIERLGIRLLFPTDRPVGTRFHHVELTPEVHEANGVREVRVSREHLPPLFIEEEYPRWYIPAAWLEISEYANWKEVRDWAQPMYRLPDDLSPELLAQIEQWRSTSHTPEEAALRALNFVQQEIRYFGVEIGASSHRPAHPNQVFRQRYGDCKDKSLLLATLLNRLGMKAWPALVSARFQRGIADFLPTPHAFDHVITLAEIGGKRWWLDATNNFQSGDFPQRGYNDFGLALVIGDGSEQPTPMEVPDNGELAVDEHYRISAFDQPVALTVTEHWRGAAADQMRYRLVNAGIERLTEFRYNQYARQFQNIRREGATQINDNHEANEVILTDRYVVDNFFQHGGGRWRAELYDMTLREWLDYPKVIKRKSPLGLNPDIHLRYHATLELARRNSGSSNESLLVADDHLQFASFIQHDGSRIELGQELDFLGDHVPAAAVGSYVERQTEIRRHLGFTFGFPDRSSNVWSSNTTRQALLHAANIGDATTVERLLAEGAHVNGSDANNITPLLVATMDSRIEVIKLLLTKGANANARSEDGWTPLLTAALFGSEDVVAELLRAGADVKMSRNGQTPLMLAAEKGHAGVIRQLLAHGAETDRRDVQHYNHTALMYAALGGHAEAVRALLDGGANPGLRDEKAYNALLLAAESGDWPTIALLQQAGLDINEISPPHHLSLLVMLANSNRYEAVAAALDAGANPDLRADNGFTALMYARQNGNRRLAHLLESRGAHHPEVGVEGWTALMSAIERQDAVEAKRLIAAGADVNAVDRYGMSALSLASAFGQTELAELLIGKGANVNAVDRGWRETPLMYAVENGSKKLVELLVSRGANPNDKDVDGDSVLGRTWPMEKAELYDVLIAAGAKREFTHRANGK